MFREVMAKISRDGTILFRVTVLRKKNLNPQNQYDESNHDCENNETGDVKKVNPNEERNVAGGEDSADNAIVRTTTSGSDNSGWDRRTNQKRNRNKAAIMLEQYEDKWEDLKEPFVSHMTKNFPAIICICYNETTNHSRPTKEAPMHLLHGPDLHMTERTLSGNLPYIIGADTFCEVNHEVEKLQFDQKIEWINMHKRKYQGGIILCSGRDINSWGLGFGTMLDHPQGKKVFAEVVVVQHCPLVQRDALVNYARHEDKLKCTILHLQKEEMANGVANALEAAIGRQDRHHLDIPVVIVASGGRKGLNPSYIKMMKETRAIQCILYNSCSTKSLEKDMTDLMDGRNGYIIDEFRSYDFFGGTNHSASILRLIRRPKTLVIPIGPAGVGKSTMVRTIHEMNPDKYVTFQRDAVFASLRKKGLSMMRSKRICHDKLLDFLRGNASQNGNKNISTDRDDALVRIVDSTNGNIGARKLYIQENQPQLVILVELRLPSDDKDKILNMLLDRTRNRLKGGDANHPSFPDTVEAQKEKHQSILKGVEYPTRMEVVDNRMSGGGASSSAQRTVHLQCDPCDFKRLSALPFEIFLKCCTNIQFKEVTKLESKKSSFTVVQKK